MMTDWMDLYNRNNGSIIIK